MLVCSGIFSTCAFRWDPEPGNGARLGCRQVRLCRPTRPSGIRTLTALHPYCTSDMAPAIDALLRSGRRVLTEEMQSGFGYPLPVSGRTVETGNVPLTPLRLIIVQAVHATTRRNSEQPVHQPVTPRRLRHNQLERLRVRAPVTESVRLPGASVSVLSAERRVFMELGSAAGWWTSCRSSCSAPRVASALTRSARSC
jgi:hypothetical protein